KVFLLDSKLARTNKKRLLILNRYRLYITPDFIYIYIINKVNLLYLLPYISYVL
ncbi:hypothetical protein BKA56DRAFT_498416, partial [Ilyonectria sp. MPI-CAGE-AT-0026]